VSDSNLFNMFTWNSQLGWCKYYFDYCWLFTENGLEHICFHEFVQVLDSDD